MSSTDQLQNGLALLKLSAEVDVGCWDDVHKAAVLVLSRAIEMTCNDNQAKNNEIARLNTFIEQWKEQYSDLEKRWVASVDSAASAQEKAEAVRAALESTLNRATVEYNTSAHKFDCMIVELDNQHSALKERLQTANDRISDRISGLTEQNQYYHTRIIDNVNEWTRLDDKARLAIAEIDGMTTHNAYAHLRAFVKGLVK